MQILQMGKNCGDEYAMRDAIDALLYGGDEISGATINGLEKYLDFIK